jgi:hypothetical protein
VWRSTLKHPGLTFCNFSVTLSAFPRGLTTIQATLPTSYSGAPTTVSTVNNGERRGGGCRRPPPDQLSKALFTKMFLSIADESILVPTLPPNDLRRPGRRLEHTLMAMLFTGDNA